MHTIGSIDSSFCGTNNGETCKSQWNQQKKSIQSISHSILHQTNSKYTRPFKHTYLDYRNCFANIVESVYGICVGLMFLALLLLLSLPLPLFSSHLSVSLSMLFDVSLSPLRTFGALVVSAHVHTCVCVYIIRRVTWSVEFNESRKVSRFSLLKSFATFGSLFHKPHENKKKYYLEK